MEDGASLAVAIQIANNNCSGDGTGSLRLGPTNEHGLSAVAAHLNNYG
jgi:hypothetical protein